MSNKITFNARKLWAEFNHTERLAMAKIAPIVVPPWRIGQLPMIVDGKGECPYWERGFCEEFAGIVLIDGVFFASVFKGKPKEFEIFKDARNYCDNKIINGNATKYVLDGFAEDFVETCPIHFCKEPFDKVYGYCSLHNKDL